MHGWHLLGARYHHNDWLFAIQITSLQTRCELSLYADLTYWNPTQTPNQLFQVSFEWKNLCCRRSVSNALLIFIVVVCSYFPVCVCLLCIEHGRYQEYVIYIAIILQIQIIWPHRCREYLIRIVTTVNGCYLFMHWTPANLQPLWARIELFEHLGSIKGNLTFESKWKHI